MGLPKCVYRRKSGLCAHPQCFSRRCGTTYPCKMHLAYKLCHRKGG